MMLAWVASAAWAGKTYPLDREWKFKAGDQPGAQATALDDGAWRTVNLPHDWSIETAPAKNGVMSGPGGFFPAGVGWYRRAFEAPAEWKGQRITIMFEGVYMNADVWLNGVHLGFHPYGYTSFYYDLTSQMKAGGKNVLVVRVDNSKQINSRWYSGSGIYRHVWLTVSNPVHVVPWGVWVTTPEAAATQANVTVKTQVRNEGPLKRRVKVATALSNNLLHATEAGFDLPAGASREVTQTITVDRPTLWSPDHPVLYYAKTTVVSDGEAVDEVQTPFGIRALAWSAEKGLLLNGEPIKLCGGCVHHDNGPLGAAAFDRAEERRVELLKAAGFNAIRTAHNPPSPAFLEACDRIGMMVMDEAFDCWEKGKNKNDYSVAFKEWWKRDLSSMVLRDRNHPSVFCWSIGNEVVEHDDPVNGPRIGKMLAEYVRTLDPTRPVTTAICGVKKGQPWSDTDELFAALDIGGYNYTLNNDKKDHERFPKRVMAATESFPRAAFDYWRRTMEQPYVIGDFVWTALDYLGESGIGRCILEGEKESGHGQGDLFPWHGAFCGDLDICGFRKPVSHYRNILWGRGEKLYAAVLQPPPAGKKIKATTWAMPLAQDSWTWPGQEGKPLTVEVYSGCDKVRLTLNDKLIGEKPTTIAEQFKATFEVPYAPGTLKVVGMKGERQEAEFTLRTVDKAAQVKLTADRAALPADGQGLSFVTVEVADKDGRRAPNADNEIEFEISGPGVIAGVGSGDMESTEPYQGKQRRVCHGQALVVVRSTGEAGQIKLTARTRGLAEASVVLLATPWSENRYRK